MSVSCKIKKCGNCYTEFNPTGRNQKYCSNCKKEMMTLGERNSNRKEKRYVNREIECPACGCTFKTYYGHKKYCGSDECDIIRIRNKNRISCIRNLPKFRERTKVRQQIKLVQKKEEIKKFIEGENYSITNLDDYKNSHNSKIHLICTEGHEWHTTFHSFKDSGARCMRCYTLNNYISRPEKAVLSYFEINHPSTELVHRDRKEIHPQELDLFFPNAQLGVEVCGLYWHSELNGKSRDYHYNKMIKCKNKNIRLITVFEDEINNYFDVVISRIKNALGLIEHKIFARKCESKEIKVSKANDFFKKYHLQGSAAGSIAFGLFYNNDLVQVLSGGKPARKHTSKGYNIIELKRLAALPDLNVVGGASKLFNLFIKHSKEHNYDKIKSYCDMRYANIAGSVYEKLGFELNAFTRYTPHYVRNGDRFRNMTLRKTPIERLTGKTEWELRQAQGYDRIWDCGHETYVYDLEMEG